MIKAVMLINTSLNRAPSGEDGFDWTTLNYRLGKFFAKHSNPSQNNAGEEKEIASASSGNLPTTMV
jgi:hypothetical protein